MTRRVRSVLAASLLVTIGLVALTSNPDILYGKGKSEPWFSDHLDPLRFLKRFAGLNQVGTGKKAPKTFKVDKGKRSKRKIKKWWPPRRLDPTLSWPLMCLSVCSSTWMVTTMTWEPGLAPTTRPSRPALVSTPVRSTTVGATTRWSRRTVASPVAFAGDSDQIAVVDDQDAGYSGFFAPTRLGIAREGLAQVIEENQAIVRFGLVRSRYGVGAVLPAYGNKNQVELVTSPQDALPGDQGNGQWRITVPWTTTTNDSASASGNEVLLIAADISDSSNATYNLLLLDPDEAGGLLPAGRGLDDSLDSPIDDLLVDTRAEVTRLMAADLAAYSECRNTAVVLVVGGAGGTNSLAVEASTFLNVSGGGVTHRVPIFVVAVAPPAADVATLQSIATSSGGKYFEVSDTTEVAFAANYAVQAVHQLTEDYDLGRPSIFPTTSPGHRHHRPGERQRHQWRAAAKQHHHRRQWRAADPAGQRDTHRRLLAAGLRGGAAGLPFI